MNSHSPVEKAAIVDVGSNSLVLTIYDCAQLPPKKTFEQRAICGLARGMKPDEPKLDKQGQQSALTTLEEFQTTITSHAVDAVFAVGTAALRAVHETKAGQKFIGQAEKALGHPITVITDTQEAAYSGMGILMTLPPYPSGVFCGMGGGSTEFGLIDHGELTSKLTAIHLGSLTISTQDPKAASEEFGKAVQTIPWISERKGETLYLTGGIFRAVARLVTLATHEIPLTAKLAHGMPIPWRQAKKALEEISKFSPEELITQYGEKGKENKAIIERSQSIPWAAAALVTLGEITETGFMTPSRTGLREGVLYAGMQGRLRAE